MAQANIARNVVGKATGKGQSLREFLLIKPRRGPQSPAEAERELRKTLSG